MSAVGSSGRKRYHPKYLVGGSYIISEVWYEDVISVGRCAESLLNGLLRVLRGVA